MTRPRFRGLAAAVLLAFSAACETAAPTSALVEPQPAPVLGRLQCTVQTATGALACRDESPRTGSASGLVVGGPNGTYVQLAASGHTYTPADSLFSINVTVQNRMFQALGTADGTTPHPDGVRVLFDLEPYPTAGDLGAELEIVGGVERAFILRANQAFYRYSEILQPDSTSAPVAWSFRMPPAVTSFGFTVYVMGQVPHPEGAVEVTPAIDTLSEGAGTTLAATVRNPYGTVLAGETVVWGTSDTAVATVDSSGTVTAVAPGLVTITATAGTRTGAATIAVCAALAVGEAYTAAMPGASSLCFAGDAGSSAEYVYIPTNLSSADALSLSVTGNGIVGVTGPPTPALLPAGGPRLARADAPDAGTDALHMDRLQRDRDLAMRLMSQRGGARSAPGGPRAAITPGIPAVGDLWSLNVAQGCSGADLRTGRVAAVGTHVIIVADTTNPAGGFTAAQYDSIALEFDSIAHPVNTANFGAPTDRDGNGRVVAFYTRAVNELSPPASSAIVGGYFSSRDLFPSAQCATSNDGEMFYMLVPDPTGAVNGNVRTVSSVRGGTVGTMGHEMQHLINAARRIYVNGAAVYEEVWLNEGLSHIAEELMFYRMSVGLAPRGNIALSTLTSGTTASRRVAAFNTYANQNYGRLRSWLQRPDTAGPVKSSDVLAVRGAIWAFLRYAADRRNGSDDALWYDLVNAQNAGTANLQDVLGVDPNAWVADFASAMYADDAVSGVGAAQQVTSWNFRSVYAGLGGVPHGVNPLTNGVAHTRSYSRGGGSGFIRFGVPAGAFASVTALSGGVVPGTPYALTVVRTR